MFLRLPSSTSRAHSSRRQLHTVTKYPAVRIPSESYSILNPSSLAIGITTTVRGHNNQNLRCTQNPGIFLYFHTIFGSDY